MADFLIHTGGLPDWIAWAITASLAAFFILNVIAGGALAFIWAERKIAARIQDRLGPTRTGGKFGWLQSLADGIKLLTKEDLMPDGADGLLFRLAPYVSFCASFAAFIALPFAFDFVGQRLNVGVFFNHWLTSAIRSATTSIHGSIASRFEPIIAPGNSLDAFSRNEEPLINGFLQRISYFKNRVAPYSS